jgi:hypothetical protein
MEDRARGEVTISRGFKRHRRLNSHFFLRRFLDADLKRSKKDLDHSNSSKLFVKIRPNEIAQRVQTERSRPFFLDAP